MNEEPTLPPVRQPNTFRTWIPRLWRFCTGAVAAHPDLALAAFLILFGAAVVF